MLTKLRIKRLKRKIKEHQYQTDLLDIYYQYKKINDAWYEYIKEKYSKNYRKLKQKLNKLQGRADGR